MQTQIRLSLLQCICTLSSRHAAHRCPRSPHISNELRQLLQTHRPINVRTVGFRPIVGLIFPFPFQMAIWRVLLALPSTSWKARSARSWTNRLMKKVKYQILGKFFAVVTFYSNFTVQVPTSPPCWLCLVVRYISILFYMGCPNYYYVATFQTRVGVFRKTRTCQHSHRIENTPTSPKNQLKPWRVCTTFYWWL